MFTPAPSQATHSEHSVQAEGEPGVRPAGTRPGAAGAGRAGTWVVIFPLATGEKQRPESNARGKRGEGPIRR